MNVVVTGGAGFIGSHLVERLIADGHRVLVIDDLSTGRIENLAGLARRIAGGGAGYTLLTLDVAGADPMGSWARYATDLWPPERVYHLASPASPADFQRDPVRTMLTNVVGTERVLALAREAGARFLLASTSEVYGEPEVHPQPESYRGAVNTTGPRACYDEGKRAAEALTADYARMHGLDVRIARIFNTYGPRMRADDGRLVPNFITQALAGQPITVYGGPQTRCLCYVTDLVDGLVRLMEGDVLGPVNLGSDEEHSVADLAERIRDLARSASVLEYRPLPEDDPTRRRPLLNRARGELGWTARTELDDGLRATLAHFAGLGQPA